MIIHEWIIYALIAIFGVHALREALEFTGIVPRDWKYGWLVYGRYDEQLIELTLRKLGFDRTEIATSIRLVGQLKIPTLTNPLVSLLGLIHRHLAKFDRQLEYGKQTPITSQFYINTMEAVHDRDEIMLMCTLLNTLLQQRKTAAYPDFIITPKTGNPALGVRFAEMNGLPFVLRKDKSDTSRARFDPGGEARNNFLINFEGAAYLLQLEQRAIAEERKLIGAVIDCNASGGSAIYDSMVEFNDMIRRMKVAIEPVQEAYILFRPDNKDDIDGRFRSQGLEIHRFLDLSEEVKEEIHRSTIKESLRSGNRTEAEQLLRRMQANKLIRTESRNELG